MDWGIALPLPNRSRELGIFVSYNYSFKTNKSPLRYSFTSRVWPCAVRILSCRRNCNRSLGAYNGNASDVPCSRSACNDSPRWTWTLGIPREPVRLWVSASSSGRGPCAFPGSCPWTATPADDYDEVPRPPSGRYRLPPLRRSGSTDRWSTLFGGD